MNSRLPAGTHPCWVEISLSRLEQNLQAIRRHVGPQVDVCCVVKADAYGHGAVAVSQFLQSLQVRRWAVASVEEGIELRRNGINGEILVLCGAPASQERIAAEHHLTVSIHSREACDRLIALGRPLRAHLEFNSGMNRLGLSESDLHAARRRLQGTAIDLTGTYSHLSSSTEPDEAFSRLQWERFQAATSGGGWGARHLANSGGLRFPEALFDFVRVGILLYGYNPAPSLPVEVRPVLCWKAKALQVETLPAGSPVSYSRTFVTRRETRIATLPLGYADGFSRKFSNRGYVLAGESICPVLGRVTMDMTVVDVTDAPVDGDTEFAILNDRRSAADLAADLETIPWEVLCAIGARVTRVYL
ncbi:MAG: alanine racemase [Acidobacteria bacterium]|nr:alanine racemase [Acidobacteriota bacterium]